MTTYKMVVQKSEGGPQQTMAETLTGSLKQVSHSASLMCQHNDWYGYTLYTGERLTAAYADYQPFSEFKRRKRPRPQKAPLLPPELLPTGIPTKGEVGCG